MKKDARTDIIYRCSIFYILSIHMIAPINSSISSSNNRRRDHDIDSFNSKGQSLDSVVIKNG